MPQTQILNAANQVTITLDGDTGDVVAGGNGQDGDIIVRTTGGVERIRLDGQAGSIKARSAVQVEVFGVNGDTGEVILRGVNVPGPGAPRIRLEPGGANVWVGGNGQDGDIILFRSAENATDDQTKATIQLGGSSGDLALWRQGGSERIRLNGQAGSITVRSNALVEVFGVNGNTGEVILRGVNAPGQGAPRIRLDPGGANIWVGGHGQDGDIVLFHQDENATDDATKATIHLNGSAGDIVLRNADCAEDFDVEESEAAEPGTVMVLAEEGKLRRSDGAYDKKVAGVISGAGDYRPGIVLDRQSSRGNRQPVALVGKAYCKVDALYSPVEVGDLLTTSPTPGHAMKADDPLKAFGAVLGKALRPLAAGRGLIPILIALQ